MDYRVTHGDGDTIIRWASRFEVTGGGVLTIRGEDGETVAVFNAGHWLRVEVSELDSLAEKRDSPEEEEETVFNIAGMSAIKRTLLDSDFDKQKPGSDPPKPEPHRHILFPSFRTSLTPITLCGLYPHPVAWHTLHYADVEHITCLPCLHTAVRDGHSMEELYNHGKNIRAVAEPEENEAEHD